MISAMLDWLHDLPTASARLLVCAVFVVPTLVGSYLLQPYVARLFRGERDINTVLGFLLNAFALYFGVLLALLSIAVFENHNRADDAVVREAAAIDQAVPRPARLSRGGSQADLPRSCDRYVDEVIGPGWSNPGARPGQSEGNRYPDRFPPQIGAIRPTGHGAEAFAMRETLRALDGFVEARRLRISAGDERDPEHHVVHRAGRRGR